MTPRCYLRLTKTKKSFILLILVPKIVSNFWWQTFFGQSQNCSIEGTWKIFNGNEIGTLLAWWQLQVHNQKFGEHFVSKDLILIASTVSSNHNTILSQIKITRACRSQLMYSSHCFCSGGNKQDTGQKRLEWPVKLKTRL